MRSSGLSARSTWRNDNDLWRPEDPLLVSLQEDMGESASLRAELAELRCRREVSCGLPQPNGKSSKIPGRNQELAQRNRDLEGCSWLVLYQTGPAASHVKPAQAGCKLYARAHGYCLGCKEHSSAG